MKMVRLLNYYRSVIITFIQEPECKLLNLKEEVPSDEAANPPSSLNELSSQEKFNRILKHLPLFFLAIKYGP